MEHSTNIITVDVDALELFEKPNLKGTPERNLLMAILERAILDFVGNDQREVTAAEEWIFGEDDTEEDEFSFPWLCQQLDLDRSFVAETVRAMPKRGKRRVAPWYFKEAS